MLRNWGRLLRRLRHRLFARGLPLVFDSRYETSLWGVPLDPLRGEKILAALESAGLFRPAELARPRPVSLENLLRVHTADYLQSLQEPQSLTRILGVEVPLREAERTIDLHRLMLGGTIWATRLALRGGRPAVHLGGGFHHAFAGSGQGFCIFNDVAVAIARLRARGYDARILVVDLDLHDGNGTRELFAADRSVHTFSIHHEHWGDTHAVESTAIALGPDVGDIRYLAALRESLPPVFEAFQPGLVFYLAGTDVSEDDALGNWKLTAQGVGERDRLVTWLARAAQAPRPLVVLLAGGYGRAAWRHSARFLLWLASGEELEPLEEEEMTLQRVRRLVLAPPSPGAADRLAFSFDEQDLAALGPGLASQPPRLLDDLTRHGVELLLERLGVLGQLRSRGFRALRVELEHGQPLGPTLRVVAEDHGEELLIELRVNRSRRAIPEMEVLVIEWLLLQNPRAAFTARRPRLPGQRHPGLGLLKDILGWLVVICENRGLDGVFFRPSHYHVAMQSRTLVRFLRAEDEARARAFAAALQGLSLADAAQALASGGAVVEETGERVAWQPAPMVLPVSARLKTLVSGPEYESRAAELAAGLRYRLAPDALGPSRPG